MIAFAGPLLDYLGGWKYLAAVGLGFIFVGIAVLLLAWLAGVRILRTLDRLNAFLLEAQGTLPTESVARREYLELTLARYRGSHRGPVKRAMRDLRILGASVERGAERGDEPREFHDLERIRDLLADGVAQLDAQVLARPVP